MARASLAQAPRPACRSGAEQSLETDIYHRRSRVNVRRSHTFVTKDIWRGTAAGIRIRPEQGERSGPELDARATAFGERVPLWREVVREVRQHLAAVRGDEHEILQAAAAPAGAVEPGLDGDDVARDELARRAPEPGLLVHLEPDAVAEAVEETVLQHLPRLLRELRREAVLVEELADRPVQLAARDSGLDPRHRQLERLRAQVLVADELRVGGADDEGPRHVRVAAGLAVAREEVEDDRLARRDRAVAHLVADRGLGAVRDDELLRGDAVRAERVLDGELQALAGQRLAVEHEARPVRLGAPQQVARRGHAGLRAPLRPADAGELGFRLDAAPAGGVVALPPQPHAGRAPGGGERERGRGRAGRSRDG